MIRIRWQDGKLTLTNRANQSVHLGQDDFEIIVIERRGGVTAAQLTLRAEIEELETYNIIVGPTPSDIADFIMDLDDAEMMRAMASGGASEHPWIALKNHLLARAAGR